MKSVRGRKISKKQALRDPNFILSLSKDLYKLSCKMKDLGVKMDYYGGFGEMGKHGRELVNASALARSWANEIKNNNL